MHKKYKQVLLGENDDLLCDNDKLESFDVEHVECDDDFSESKPSSNARPIRTRKPPVWLHDYKADLWDFMLAYGYKEKCILWFMKKG